MSDHWRDVVNRLLRDNPDLSVDDIYGVDYATDAPSRTEVAVQDTDPGTLVTPYGIVTNEHELQSHIMLWAQDNEHVWPELELLHAIPNGGHRYRSEGARMKREGVKRGIPDLHLPVARCGFHGLYIEMKFDRPGSRAKLTPAQEHTIPLLKAQGNHVCVRRKYTTTIATLAEYLSGDLNHDE